jgi:hypothetical protein
LSGTKSPLSASLEDNPSLVEGRITADSVGRHLL